MSSEIQVPSLRAPYQPPRLRVYGTLRELTLKNGGVTGKNDGGGGNDKTGF